MTFRVWPTVDVIGILWTTKINHGSTCSNFQWQDFLRPLALDPQTPHFSCWFQNASQLYFLGTSLCVATCSISSDVINGKLDVYRASHQKKSWRMTLAFCNTVDLWPILLKIFARNLPNFRKKKKKRNLSYSWTKGKRPDLKLKSGVDGTPYPGYHPRFPLHYKRLPGWILALLPIFKKCLLPLSLSAQLLPRPKWSVQAV